MTQLDAPKGFSSEQLMAMALEDEPRQATTCKYCKKGNLQWIAYKGDGGVGKWILVEVDNDRLKKHVCAEGKSAMEFQTAPTIPKFNVSKYGDFDTYLGLEYPPPVGKTPSHSTYFLDGNPHTVKSMPLTKEEKEDGTKKWVPKHGFVKC